VPGGESGLRQAELWWRHDSGNKIQTEVFELGKQNVELRAELTALKRRLPGRFDAFAESLGFTAESPEGDQCRPTTPRRPDRWAEA